MRLFRTITAVAVGLAVASLPGAAGAAQPVYPPGLPSLTLSATTVEVGDTVTLIGDNFGPTETVDISITINPLAARAPGTTNRGGSDTLAMAMVPAARHLPARYDPGSLQVSTDADGDFRVRYRLRYPGEYTFTAVGRESGFTASASLTVIGRGPHLPVTGDDVGAPLAVGSGLLVTGVLLMLLTLAWRRRGRRRGAGTSEFETVR